jgi:16S rRNA (guanine527-N7)-methyltransferase
VTSREFTERLARRARKADVEVPAEAIERLETYYQLLARWNERINLTSLPLRDPTDATFDRLLIEPFAAARFMPGTRINWFDLGSGGGSPALPLKLVRPSAHLTMVEAKTRKAAFLREAVRVLMLQDAIVQDVRFESLGDRPEVVHSVDVVTVRAVRANEALIGTAAKLLVPQGRLLLFADPSAVAPRMRGAFSCEQTAKLSVNGSRLSMFIRLN